MYLKEVLRCLYNHRQRSIMVWVKMCLLFLFPIFSQAQNLKGYTLIFKGGDFEVYMYTNVKKIEAQTYKAEYVRVICNSKYANEYKQTIAEALDNPNLLKLSYNRQTVLVDLRNNRIKTLQITYYDACNVPITTQQFDTWDYVAPNTFSDIVYRSMVDITMH